MVYKLQCLLCLMVQVPSPQREGFRRYRHKFIHVHQNPITGLISQAHSFISDGKVTKLLATYPYKHQSLLHPTVQIRPNGSGDMITQSYSCTPKTPKHAQAYSSKSNCADVTHHHVRISENTETDLYKSRT